MFDYIKGEITDLGPTYAVIETNGVGYFVHISLNVYSELQLHSTQKLFVSEVIREDTFDLYGFVSKRDREVFLLLTSVSGIGSNTARMMMSSMLTFELETAILTGNIVALKAIKGIGAKTAERIVLELRDKIGKSSGTNENFATVNNTIQTEALSALVMLGFNKVSAQKVINTLVSGSEKLTIEQIIKQALKLL